MAFRIIQNIDKWPVPYPRVERKDPSVNDKGWDKVGGFTLRDKVDFMPQKGLQERFVSCDSNLIFLCGESQMGKTYGMFLKALNGVGLPGYTARFISVRLQDSKKGGSIFRDAVEVCGNFANCQYNASDYPTFTWPQWNNAMQLIHSNFNTANPSEWGDFKEYAKKNQASYICVDEATDMREFKMFAYWFSRNRDSSGMTPQMVLSFNFEHEHFTTTMLKDAGYIGDDWYFKPEMNGVTRYFYVSGDDESGIIWGDTPEAVAEIANITITDKERKAGVTINQIVKSFTAFTGESADNLKLIAATGGQNIGNLHNTGATSRAILKCGYAGPVDNSKSSVSRNMIQQLWSNAQNYDENMYAAMDISSGQNGNDDAPMFIAKGNCLIAVEYYTGEGAITDWMAKMLAKHKVPYEHFVYDGTGMGYLLKDFTRGIPLVVNKSPLAEYDENGNRIEVEQYTRLRSQLLSKLEAALKRGEITCTIPRDYPVPFGRKGQKRKFIDALLNQIEVFIFSTVNGKKHALTKEEFKKKYHYSPNEMDALYLLMYFFLDTRERKQPKPIITNDAYDELYSRPPRHLSYGRRIYR